MGNRYKNVVYIGQPVRTQGGRTGSHIRIVCVMCQTGSSLNTNLVWLNPDSDPVFPRLPDLDHNALHGRALLMTGSG